MAFSCICVRPDSRICSLSLHDALPISLLVEVDLDARLAALEHGDAALQAPDAAGERRETRSEEHTSELQSRLHLVCRLLLEKKKSNKSRCRQKQQQQVDGAN